MHHYNFLRPKVTKPRLINWVIELNNINLTFKKQSYDSIKFAFCAKLSVQVIEQPPGSRVQCPVGSGNCHGGPHSLTHASSEVFA